MGLHTVPVQSVPAGGSVTLTVKALNSQLGDSVILTPRNPDASFANLLWHAWVSAADTVTIKLVNPTTSPVSTVSQGFDVRVVVNH